MAARYPLYKRNPERIKRFSGSSSQTFRFLVALGAVPARPTTALVAELDAAGVALPSDHSANLGEAVQAWSSSEPAHMAPPLSASTLVPCMTAACSIVLTVEK